MVHHRTPDLFAAAPIAVTGLAAARDHDRTSQGEARTAAAPSGLAMDRLTRTPTLTDLPQGVMTAFIHKTGDARNRIAYGVFQST